MNDAEYLTQLLGYLPPPIFRAFLQNEFNYSLPLLDDKTPYKQQRRAFFTALSQLESSCRQHMDDSAESIIVLSDECGQRVLEGFARDLCDESRFHALTTLPDQYQRALWLYTHERALFNEALQTRQADIVRTNITCYSGFKAPKNAPVLDDIEAREMLQHEVARYLECPATGVAVQIFKRLRSDSEASQAVDIVHIRIYHNSHPILVDCVHNGELVSRRVIRAELSHITYEPANGHLEVTTQSTLSRENLARLVIRVLMPSEPPVPAMPSHRTLSTDPVHQRVIVKRYDYQRLSTPTIFDISEEPIAYTKVIELGYSDLANRTLLIKINYQDVDDIYTASKSLINPVFDFSQYPLNYAKLAVRLKRTDRERGRTISIILRGDNECNIKSKHDRDRALCDRLLHKWRLIKDRKDRECSAHDYVAA
ncbi:MAG TPA: hypothetical protein PKD17_08245 [Cellvibrionaceae bacterium]|nr:hypothetical protein [Cellvibrionaceae bacterium]HNG61337.1 hypothetical protein [Cellvibrionaceae bacterium]